MRTIGVGLIGTGFMGKCHTLAYRSVRAVFDTPLAPRLIGSATGGRTPPNTTPRDPVSSGRPTTGGWWWRMPTSTSFP